MNWERPWSMIQSGEQQSSPSSATLGPVIHQVFSFDLWTGSRVPDQSQRSPAQTRHPPAHKDINHTNWIQCWWPIGHCSGMYIVNMLSILAITLAAISLLINFLSIFFFNFFLWATIILFISVWLLRGKLCSMMLLQCFCDFFSFEFQLFFPDLLHIICPLENSC